MSVCHADFCGACCTGLSLLQRVYFLMGMSTAVFECICTHTHTSSHQTLALWATTHCSIFFSSCVCSRVCVHVYVCMSLLPIHRPLCVGVCQRCCLQAGPHCFEPLLLIDTGPLALRVPMAPQPWRTEGWNRSPGPWESLLSLFALSFLYPGAPGAHIYNDRAKWIVA